MLGSQKAEEIALENINTTKRELFEVLDSLKEVMERGGLLNKEEEINVNLMISRLNDFIIENVHQHNQLF